MSRRFATMVVTAVLLVALVVIAWVVPVPFVTMSPGPTENVLGTVRGKPIIELPNAHRTDGRLDLTTVAATSPDQKVDLVEALRAWWDPSVAVIPRGYLYPDDQTPQEVQQINAEAMTTSQQDAIAAALRLKGYRVPDAVVVQAIVEDAPALGRLKAGDVIRSVNGKPIRTPGDVRPIVSRLQVGDTVRFDVLRAGRPTSVDVRAGRSPEKGHPAYVGIQVAAGYQFPIEVRINLGQDIGGPSAGTMFALGIYDKLTTGKLAGGKHIAGTGTIDGKGVVGPIGGIQQKVIAASRAGATVFLVPEDNCAAAAEVHPRGVRLVRIEKLSGAVDALTKLSHGTTSGVPTCEGAK